MSPHYIAIFLAALLPPAGALDLGQCGPTRIIQSELAGEGQHMLASATSLVGSRSVPIYLTSNNSNKNGYYLHGSTPGTLCVLARVAEIETNTMAPLTDQDVCSLQNSAPSAKSVCNRLSQQLKGSGPQRYVSFTSPTSLAMGGGPVAVRMGFCALATGQNILCSTSETRISSVSKRNEKEARP
jgi:hypothetical protein